MNSANAELGDDAENETAFEEQVSPETFRQIYELGTQGRDCAACPQPEAPVSLAFPLVIGYGLAFAALAFATWGSQQKNQTLGDQVATLQLKLQESEQELTAASAEIKQAVLEERRLFAARLEEETAVAARAGIDGSLSKLWKHLFVPALLGETTYGTSAADFFPDRASLELLSDSIPKVREKALDELAAARAYVILDEFQEATMAYDESIKKFGADGAIGKLVSSEKKALLGESSASILEVLAILKETRSRLNPIVPLPVESTRPPNPLDRDDVAPVAPSMLAPLTRLEAERLRGLEALTAQSLHVIFLAGGPGVDTTLPCYVPSVNACLPQHFPDPNGAPAAPAPAGVSQVPTPLTR